MYKEYSVTIPNNVEGSDTLEFDEQERQTLLDMVEDVAGLEVRKVAILLLDHDDEVTDEILAEELNVKLDEVRKALYKLSDLEIASFRRIKDKVSGWYIYYWRIHPERINEIVLKKQRAVHWKILERLQYEREHMFFSCGNRDCFRITFDEAMEYDFICPNCGQRLEDFDNSRLIEILQRKADELNNIIEENRTRLKLKQE